MTARTCFSPVRLRITVTAAVRAIRLKAITVAAFARRTHPRPPVLRNRPGRKCGYSLRLLVLVEINPRALKIVEIPTQTKTGPSPFKGLRIRRAHPVRVAGPLFPVSRLARDSEDRTST